MRNMYNNDTSEKSTERKATKRVILRRSLSSLLISVLLPLSLLISVPFEIFVVNAKEYVFVLSDFFPTLVGFFFLATFVIFAALFFLPKKAFRIVAALIIALSLMCFLQGNYLNGGLNTIGGDNLEGESFSSTTAAINICIWIVVVVVALVLACLRDKKKIISYIGLVLALIVLLTQIVAPITVAASKGDVLISADTRKEELLNDKRYILTDKNLCTPSSDGNVYWFIIDRFDESFAEQAEKNDPELLNGLQGFTWFQNHVACYTHTYPAVAQMLTDVKYDAEKSRVEYLQNAFKDPAPLNILNNAGYSVNLYTQAYYCYDNATSLPSYVANRAPSKVYEIRDCVGLAFSVVGVGLYRDFPVYLKRVLTLNSETSNNYVNERDANENVKYASDKFPDMNFTKRDGKGFYFIHWDGCHNSMEPNNGSKEARENLKQLNNYFDYLKANGLYDNATIIITGDHGVMDNSGTLTRPSMTALFVKPSGAENQPLKKSMAPTSHDNLWATIYKSEGITPPKDYGPSVFDIAEDSTVPRTLYSHSWAIEFYEVTYQVMGDAHNFDNWKVVGTRSLGKTLMD